MLRRIIFRCFLAGLAVVLLVTGGFVITCVMVTSTPAVYTEASDLHDIEDGKRRFEQTLVRLAGVSLTPGQISELRRKEDAEDLFSPEEWVALMDDVGHGLKRTTQTIRQDDLNAWMAQELSVLPGGDLQDPRIIFSEGRMTLAARMPMKGFSIVWGIEMTPIVTPDRLELEIQDLRAGHLPLPVDRIAQLLADTSDVKHGRVSFDVHSTPPRLCFDWDPELRLRIVDVVVIDHAIELTVEAIDQADEMADAVVSR
ncbi:MAG: hypothetical protein R3C02_17700 [Planctomycetaceae bacterium]